jgi:PhoPQ-activated pathogenicity-related protein
MATTAGPGYKCTVIELTSQTWRSASEVDRPVWKHWLIVVKPEQIAHDTALLFIGGGSNKDPMPTSAPERLVRFTLETQSVVRPPQNLPRQDRHARIPAHPRHRRPVQLPQARATQDDA